MSEITSNHTVNSTSRTVARNVFGGSLVGVVFGRLLSY